MRWFARGPAVTAAALLVVLAVLAGCGAGGSGGTGGSAALPDLELTTLDGDAVSFDDLHGTPAVVNIWQETCAPCRKEMPAFEQVHQELGDRVRFVGLNSQDDVDRAKAFAQQLGITYELWTDQEAALFSALDLTSLPATVFVAADGTVVATHRGALTAGELRAQVQELFPA